MRRTKPLSLTSAHSIETILLVRSLIFKFYFVLYFCVVNNIFKLNCISSIDIPSVLSNNRQLFIVRRVHFELLLIG